MRAPSMRSAAVFAALQEFGFLILKDHNVPVELLDRAYSLSQALFAQDTAEKLRYRGGLRGYTPFGTEHAKNNSYPDLKEFWQIGRELPPGVDYGENFPANVWPQNLPEFRETFLALYAGLDETARLVLQALTPGLELTPDYFDGRVRNGNSILRLIHYPPVPPDAVTTSVSSTPPSVAVPVRVAAVVAS